MKHICLNTWDRKQHFEHFSALADPYFGLVIPFNVTKAYEFSKTHKLSFFARYLHDCMKAINSIENFKYRIDQGTIVAYDKIHASATIMRENKTFAFSFIEYNENLKVFKDNIEKEKLRINKTDALFPEKNGLDCIHCSSLPWVNFTGHKEPVSGAQDSVPKLAFGKAHKINNDLIMNVSIHVNHALVDGYHIGLFSEKFQCFLSQ